MLRLLNAHVSRRITEQMKQNRYLHQRILFSTKIRRILQSVIRDALYYRGSCLRHTLYVRCENLVV